MNAAGPVPSEAVNREIALKVGIDPFWAPLAMVATQDLALRFQFRRRLVLQAENLPHNGPVLLAPTHRARWDALMLPMAAGRFRSVVQGPDGNLYAAVDGGDIHRLTPKP